LLYLAAVRSLLSGVFGAFLTLPGLVLVAALDSSVVFFLPLGNDFLVILMAARRPKEFWLIALLATLGSVLGTAGTYFLGWKVGETGLSRFVNRRRLDRVKQRIDRGAPLVAALGLVPPPFPYTAFVMASGALELNPWTFFPALSGFRLLRFGVEALLAWHYGTAILRWMKTPVFKWTVGSFIVLAVVGTVVSAVILWRSSRRGSG